ncbi:hypothetical protein SAMN05216464_10647 [Mucilaginibacter pineti]|uniref:Uncharacterized protein n=1 Tax=Mucilaginibacter pineti TaxID=1391627 RepID=A0A1G7CQ62_9SPHI|nr:hypothetical protein SAMN05216464_10647 [Mucilaginibacter pineti]
MDKTTAFWEERRLMLKDIESDFEVYLKEN